MIVTDGDASFVWVVRDGKVEKRAVKMGAAKDGQVPVTEGLAGGEVDRRRRAASACATAPPWS